MFVETSLLILKKKVVHTGLGKCVASQTIDVKESNIKSTRTYSGHSHVFQNSKWPVHV